jgi:hypothetical protein
MTQRANDFLIWRAGTSVEWDCTAKEIEGETGISVTAIWRTCKRRGWPLAHSNLGSNADRPAVDQIIAHPAMQNGGAT